MKMKLKKKKKEKMQKVLITNELKKKVPLLHEKEMQS
jgi:hypothetical protein